MSHKCSCRGDSLAMGEKEERGGIGGREDADGLLYWN
jgi:hypothetical protein